MKTWDINYLLNKKNILINKYCKARCDEEQYKLAQMISCYDDAISYISHDEEEDISILQGLDYDKLYHDTFGYFLGDVSDFYTRFYFDMPEEPNDFDFINTSKNKVLTVTKEFYEAIKPCFYERLANSEKTGNLRVRFERDNPNNTYLAQTFPIFSTNMCLVSSNLDKRIMDYINLIHEYGHVLNHSFNKYQMFEFYKYPLQEVPSLFFELLAGECLSYMGFDKRDLNRSYVHQFRDIVSGAGIDTFRSELINNRKLFDTDEDVIKFLDSNFYDEDLINFSKYNLIKNNMNYVFSFIVAVELYMLYLTNSDEALSKLVRIMKVANLSPKEYYDFIIELGITPLEHMGDYLDSIKGKQMAYGK